MRTWSTRPAAWAVIVALTVGLSVHAYGQTAAQDRQRQQDQQQQQQKERMGQMGRAGAQQYSPKLINANKLIGKEVRNRQGERLGRIEDVVLDPSRQRISYVVLSFGGIAGIGDKFFAVPWEAMTIPTGDEPVTFDVTKDQLQSAPGFDKDSWPSAADPRWRQSSQYWRQQRPGQTGGMMDRQPGQTGDMTGRQPGQQAGQMGGMAGQGQAGRQTDMGEEPGWDYEPAMEGAFKYRKLTQIIGLSVRDFRGEEIGDIENVMIDATRGQIAYAIIGHGGFLEIGEKLTPVPWSAVEINPQTEVARVSTDQQTLERLAINEDQLNRLSDPDFASRLHREFGQEPYWVTYGYVSPGAQGQRQSFDAWRPDSQYNKQFKADEVQTYTGTVDGVGTFRPERGAAEGLRLRVRTDQGQHLTVHVGPWAYAQQQGFGGCQFGQKVTVTGSRAMIGRREVIMATKLEAEDKTLELRDDRGQPKWNVDQLQAGGMRAGRKMPGRTGEMPGMTGQQQRSGRTGEQSPWRSTP